MSKAFVIQGDEWNYCNEKGVSCMFAIPGHNCSKCRNSEVLKKERLELQKQKDTQT